MTALDQVIDYLTKKVTRTNDGNPKANRGAVLIKTSKGWEDKVELLVGIAQQTIQQQFSRDKLDSPVGETALTNVSALIGDRVAPILHRNPLDLTHRLCVGDLLIEGFLYHGFAELDRPVRTRSSYILRAAPKWVELDDIPEAVVRKTIVGSSPDPLPPASKSMLKMYQDLFDPEAAYVKAVDKLQSVRWDINRRVLDTILKNKEKFVSDTPIPDNDAKEQKRRSKIIEWSFITKKAEVLKDWDGFYQEFSLDYRGRMYNVEPFLNFQGNDVARGLLQFWEPKEVDDNGFFWLYVHTACSFNQSYHKDEIPDWCEEDYKSYLEAEGLEDISVDKMTPNDRATWTQENAHKIREWAESDAIQLKAEKPVTFLACCYALVDAWETGYSYLPVSIDGSNNGWQHLGAISKDTHTGELVGLTPVKIQKDFYVQTAKKLIELAEGNERLSSLLSSMPMKHIRKGISKRGSMTRAYSAGASKIAENMYFDCKTNDFHEEYGITLKDCNKLARLLVKAIEQVCPGPLQTMKYLQDLAAYQIGRYEIDGCKTEYMSLKRRRKELNAIKDPTDEELQELNDVSKKLNEYTFELAYGEGETAITWLTPSGFHARYENFTQMDFKARVRLHGRHINHVLKTSTDKPDMRGFMCGISPNFIHSLDASHMALVICDWEGDFGAVHDSFSTHASDVEALVQTTKQVFVDMYDHENYFNEIQQQLTGGKDDIVQPDLGSLEIGGIAESEYFFI